MLSLRFAIVVAAGAAFLAGVAGVAAVPQERDKPDLPKGQIPDFGRPTEKGDPVPFFDYELYFPGTWLFQWRVPDSPLGSPGTIKGTEVFEPSDDGRFYKSTIEAVGPDGPFTVVSTIVYEKEQKIFARHQKDSRGFDYIQTGRIGGDLGGFYTIHYETEPFDANGQIVKLRMTTRMVSPVNFKVLAKISVDGGEFTNFGNSWWRKEFEKK